MTKDAAWLIVFALENREDTLVRDLCLGARK